MQREIIEHEDQLPSTVDELQKFILVGNEAVKSWKNKVRAIDKTNIAQDIYKQSLKDGQQMGELVLYAESKFGELLSKIDKQGKTKEYGSAGGTIPTLLVGITS